MQQKSTTSLTVFLTAYAINPYKGSEDGMGWNFLMQIARNQKVIAVTRKNNGPAIQQYQQENPQFAHLYSNIQFEFFDWPSYLIFWKKGPILSLIYFYFWQLSLAICLRKFRHQVDVVHHLNFHNDWTPSFLWMWGKPFVWGPVGHHPVIPYKFLRPIYGRHVVIADRFLWLLKNIFWNFDPFLKITARKADHVFCMHQEAAHKLGLKSNYSILPSVASEDVGLSVKSDQFIVLSAGRLVALKGFDVAIRAFHEFYTSLPAAEKKHTKFLLIGSGPEKKRLEKVTRSLGISTAVQMIDWLPRAQLMELYKNASVFLFPSHEGAGMVVSEALSYGLPVLCWDNCGPGRFIHPDSKLKVKYMPGEKSITQFSVLLRQLKHDPEFYSLERKMARSRFETSFNWDLRARVLSAVYEHVVFSAKEELASRPAFQFNTL